MCWSRKEGETQTHTSWTYLLGSAEDVSVILAEPPNTGQPSKSARELVTMQRPEVRPADGKLPPGANALFKHETEHETRKWAAGKSE